MNLGTGCELWDVTDVSSERWFRDAWQRSHNGGPIFVNLRKARRIQLEKIKSAVEAHNGPRIKLGRKPLMPLWGELGNAIRHAHDEDALMLVWPLGVRPMTQHRPLR